MYPLIIIAVSFAFRMIMDDNKMNEDDSNFN